MSLRYTVGIQSLLLNMQCFTMSRHLHLWFQTGKVLFLRCVHQESEELGGGVKHKKLIGPLRKASIFLVLQSSRIKYSVSNAWFRLWEIIIAEFCVSTSNSFLSLLLLLPLIEII